MRGGTEEKSGARRVIMMQIAPGLDTTRWQGRRFGFTILAVDCLVIETLEAFIEGLEDTEGKSRATFCKFLRSRPLFAAEFTTEDLAEQFYYQFRCGILHQAEVGGDSGSGPLDPCSSLTMGKSS